VSQVTYCDIARQRPNYTHNRKDVARSVFYVVRAMSIARQRVAKHIPAETNAWKNRISIARQRPSKQALSTIQAVFRGDREAWLLESRVPKVAGHFS
jgi:hypothetical protein